MHAKNLSLNFQSSFSEDLSIFYSPSQAHSVFVSFQAINKVYFRLVRQDMPDIALRCQTIRKLTSSYSNVTDCMKRLTSACELLFGIYDKYTNTALHFATVIQSQPLMKFLLAMGFNPNQGNCVNNTCLHLAIGGKNEKAVELLLQHKAHLLCRNNNGSTPLEKAFILKADAIAKCILSRISSLDKGIFKHRQFAILHSLILDNNFCLFELAISKTGKNHTDEYGRTLLYHAIMEERTKMKKALEAQGHTKLFQFTIKKNYWDTILFHFVGKRSIPLLAPTFDQNAGGNVPCLYLPLAETWKSFIEKVDQNPLIFSKNPTAFKRSKSYLKKFAFAVELAATLPSAKKMHELIKTQNGPFFIPCGWDEHSMVLGIDSPYIYWANRGEQAEIHVSNLEICLFNPDNLTERLIQKIMDMSRLPYHLSNRFLTINLKKILECRTSNRITQISSKLETKPHKKSTCVISNGKLCYLGGTAIGRLRNKIFLQDSEILPFYKAFTAHMREVILLKSKRK